MVCHSLLQWTTFCQTSPPRPVCLGWPHTACLGFIELDKPMVRVIRLASCLWLWFQSVCPLMPSLSAYRLTSVSLTLNVGYLLLAGTPDLGHGISPLGHSCAGQPLLLWLDSQAQPDHKPHASRNSSHLVNQDLWRAFCPFTGRSRGLSSSHCYLSHCKVLSANGAKGWASTLNLNGSVKTYKTF